MIAKGEFAAEVTEGNLTAAKTGTEQIYVRFRLLDGPNEGDGLGDYFALSDAALPYTIEKLRTMGWVGDDVTDLSSIVGNKVRLKIVHEDGQDGKVRARVKFVNRYTETKKLSGDEAQGIAARLRAKIAALDAAAGKPGAATPAGHPAARDDIPF